MAKQIYQRLLNEYPTSQSSQHAKHQLAEIEIMSLPPEQREAAREQQLINQQKEQLAECEGQKNDRCADIIYIFAMRYLDEEKRDYSMAKQMFQRLLDEYPLSLRWQQDAIKMLAAIEVQSLPTEQRQTAMQSVIATKTIDLSKKQLAICEGQKSETCAFIMIMVGGAYYQQSKSEGRDDYSMAKQMYQRVLSEYPSSQYSQAAQKMLTQIEAMQQQSARQSQAQQPQAAQPPAASRASIFIATMPSHADIYIGGKLIGKANSGELQVPVGTYQVRFVKDNFVKTESMTFQAGKNGTRFINLR
jgi:outer membrane protein assembly factor BamD (BamD/ComL family)